MMMTNDPADKDAVRRGRLAINVALLVVLVALAATVVVRFGAHAEAGPGPMPRSAALENLTGVRVSRVAVVGDGGLVTVFYVVLDPEKATRFQADRDHPPRLSSDARDGGTQRASIMRAGHAMRAGQTYYLVYENTAGALRSGETMTISYGGVALHHVPVL